MSRQQNQPHQNMYNVEYHFEDTISDLCFGESQRYLAATSWDGFIGVWEFNDDYSRCDALRNYSEPKAPNAKQRHGILRCCFNDDCSQVFYGTTAGLVYNYRLTGANESPHPLLESPGSPVIGLAYCPEISGLCVMRMQERQVIILTTEIKTVQLSGKPICMTLSGSKLFVALMGNIVQVLNIGPATMQGSSQIQSSLKYQITSIAVSRSNPAMYIIGSVFGQVEISNGKDQSFILSCHRSDSQNQSQGSEIFPSNSVAIHPNLPLAISAGGNGKISLINFEKKLQREIRIPSAYNPNPNYPLTKIAISSGGEVAAIAIGYDWSRGGEGYIRSNDNNKDNTPPVEIKIKKLSPNEFG